MRVSEDTILRIRQAADITEVVGEYVSLKKKGHNLWACCPFHNERTPSFSVAPAKGIYKCFGCGKAGDSVRFIMDIEGLGYIEALRHLAQKYQIEIEEETQTDEQLQKQNQRESILIAMNHANEFFKYLLKNDVEGQSVGMSYFRERGFTRETIEAFELGYSKDDWHALEKDATSKGFSREVLEKAGLLVRKDDKLYDRFRGRVMFPVHNLSGKVIAFGARTLKKDDKPKYLNSPETEVYLKSENLYGIFQAKNAIRTEDNCFLTEGYTDVISMHQAGIANVVASSGTSLTEGQIRLIKRFTENITVLYDGDPAGIKASLRGIDLILSQNMNVRAVVFPQGEDPDSFVRKEGGLAFKNFVQQNAKDFIAFKTELYLSEAQNDPIKKARVIREVVESISKIPDSIKRMVFFKQCSQLLGISEDILIAESNKTLLTEQKRIEKQESVIPRQEPDVLAMELAAQQKQQKEQQKEEKKDPLAELIAVQEQESIRLLLRYGQHLLSGGTPLWRHLFNEIDELNFHTPLYKEILKMYKDGLGEGVKVDADYLITYGSPEIKTMVSHLIWEKYDISENWQKMHGIVIPRETELLPTALYSNVLRLKHRVVEHLMGENLKTMQKATTDDEIMDCQRLHMELSKARTEIAGLLGTVITGDKLQL